MARHMNISAISKWDSNPHMLHILRLFPWYYRTSEGNYPFWVDIEGKPKGHPCRIAGFLIQKWKHQQFNDHKIHAWVSLWFPLTAKPKRNPQKALIGKSESFSFASIVHKQKASKMKTVQHLWCGVLRPNSASTEKCLKSKNSGESIGKKEKKKKNKHEKHPPVFVFFFFGVVRRSL